LLYCLGGLPPPPPLPPLPPLSGADSHLPVEVLSVPLVQVVSGGVLLSQNPVVVFRV
jgi:hypothetical protein